MSTIAPLVKDFLAQKSITVAGVSRTREDAANLIYRTDRAEGVAALFAGVTSAEGCQKAGSL